MLNVTKKVKIICEKICIYCYLWNPNTAL